MSTASGAFQASLASARAKLARANVHRVALDAHIVAVFAAPGNQVVLSAEREADSAYHVLRIRSLPDFDPILLSIGTLVGDAIQNLRAALDHAMWQLACVRWDGTPPHPKRVYFPIDDDRGNFEGRPVRDDIRPEHRAVIESHQPYHGQDGRPDRWSGPYIHALGHLRDLTNDDKHRVVTPVFLLPNQLSLEVADAFMEPMPVTLHGFEIPMGFDFTAAGERVELGAPVGRAALVGRGDKLQIDHAGTITPTVAFSEGRPVVSVLRRLAQRLGVVLDDIDAVL